jgi:ribulose-phosphate 3-epimerase
MKVIPAILAERENDFFYLIRQAEAFTDYVQIDIMDGFFVPSRSFPVPALNRLTTTLDFEIHLMVKHPSAFMIQIHHPNGRKVIYHTTDHSWFKVFWSEYGVCQPISNHREVIGNEK